MHERIIYSNMPLESLDACCEKHQHIPPADHAVASASFTVEEHEYDEGVTIHEQKFAIVILTDKTTMDRGGIELTPRITMLLLDQFAELVRDTVGPELMAAAMVHAVIRKFGAQVLSDDDDDADADDVVRELQREGGGPHIVPFGDANHQSKVTPANPILGGRRRTDFRH
jgi:hypothetical protein